MTKLLFWLLVLGGVYLYFRLKSQRPSVPPSQVRPQSRTEETIDVEAEVLETRNHQR